MRPAHSVDEVASGQREARESETSLRITYRARVEGARRAAEVGPHALWYLRAVGGDHEGGGPQRSSRRVGDNARYLPAGSQAHDEFGARSGAAVRRPDRDEALFGDGAAANVNISQ